MKPAGPLSPATDAREGQGPARTIAQAFAHYEYPDVADITLEIPPRSPAQRPPVELGPDPESLTPPASPGYR